MGVIGVWNRSFLNLPTLAVLPYDQRLARLAPTCSSSRWRATAIRSPSTAWPWARPRRPCVGRTGLQWTTLVFSNAASGYALAALDFIAPLRGSWGGTLGQDLALRNCFAQTQALAFGLGLDEVKAEMAKAGTSSADIARLAPHRVYEGNRPNSLLLYPKTTARTLGNLLALYEHSVFVQGTLWGINSFDQFGVELGKKLASGISMTGDKTHRGAGRAGLAALIAYVARNR